MVFYIIHQVGGIYITFHFLTTFHFLILLILIKCFLFEAFEWIPIYNLQIMAEEQNSIIGQTPVENDYDKKCLYNATSHKLIKWSLPPPPFTNTPLLSWKRMP